MKKFLQSTGCGSSLVVGFVLSLLFFAIPSQAQVSITGTYTTQNFDGMTNSATAALPSGFRMGNASATWAAAASATTIAAGTSGTGILTGSSSGGLYNFANGVTASSTDRALGFLTSGSFAGPCHIYMKLTNNSGATITSLNISFDYEKYRSGSNSAGWDMQVQTSSAANDSTTYGSVISSGTNSWTADANNTVISNPPLTVSKTITLTGLSIPNGASYWVRWINKPTTGTTYTNAQGIGLDNIVITAGVATTNYYSKSSGNLDAVGTWGTNTDGTGTSPSNFTTAGQIFNIRNGNPGNLSGTWTVSNVSSKIVVDGTDFTIPASTAVNAIIDVNAGRTLTIKNTTQPTLGVLNATSTVKYNNLNFTSSTLVPATAPYGSVTYGNVNFDSCTVAPAAASTNLTYAGNFTLSGTGYFYGGDTTNTALGYNLITTGSANQTISGGGLLFAVRNLVNNDNTPGTSKTGTLSLNSGNTNISVANSITMNISSAGDAFSDGGNTLRVYSNISMGGAAAGYNLTGTMVAAIITSGSLSVRGYSGAAASSAVAAAPVFKNFSVRTNGTTTVNFQPVAGTATYTISGNFVIDSAGSGGVVLGTNNTIEIGGNFVHTPTTSRITFSTGSTIRFNGSSTQTYSTGVSAGHTFINMVMNNSTGLNLSSPLTVSGTLTLTSGKIRTGSNTLALTSATAVVSGGSSTSYVNGALSKVVPAAGVTSMLFEVGDTTYSPVRFGLSASATAGTIRVRSTYGSHPQIGSSSINNSAMVNRYWTVNFPVAVTSGAFPTNDSFSYATGDIIGGSNSGFTVRKYNNTASSWSTAASTVNLTTTGGVLLGNTSVAGSEPSNTVTMDYVAGQVVVINPPTITTVSPNTGISGSGGSGTAVTITGTNFNTTASNNVVYFGATKATVSSITGSTILNVNVPIGATYATVSVTDITTGLSAYYNPPFKPTFNNALFITDSINIKPRVDFNSTSLTGSKPFGGAIGDVDGDGKADMVVNNSDSSTLSIFLNASSGGTINSGSFSLYTKINISSKPNYVKLADIDGDGKLDIVCALSNSTNMAVIRNTTTTTGSPTFASITTIAVGSVSAVAALADFDGDGKIDVALSLNPAATFVGILRNTSSIGSISFGTPSTVTTGTTPNGIAVADFNGDGLPDLVSGNYSTNNASVFQNTSTSGSISFSSAVTLTTGAAPVDMQTADIDADGKMDILFTNSTDATFSVIRNIHSSGALAGGSFAGRVNFTTGSTPTGLNVGDLNGDGKLDVVVSNGAGASISVFRNTTSSGTPTFMPKVDYTAGSGPTTVTIGDLDGDKYSDIVVGNQNDRTVSVFENYPLPYVTPITGITSVCVGATTALADSVTGGTWSSSNAALATVDPSTGVVTGISGGTPTISYAVIAGGDTGYAITVVTVNALPTGGTITGAATVCPSTTATLSNSTFTGGTGSWSSSNAAVATVDPSTGVVTGVSLGSAIITFTVTSSFGCGTATDTSIINVTSSPSAGSITGTTTVCTGSTTTLSSGVSGGTWSSSASGVATVDASSGVVTGVTAGSATITYTVTNSCGTATATTSYTVNTVPATPAAITGTTTFCTGTTSTLSSTTGSGTWSSSATGVATVDPSTGVVTGVTAGSATISYTVTNSCGSTSVTASVTINGLPATPAAITGTTTLCTSFSTTLASTTGGGTWSSTSTGVATVDPSTGVVTAVSAGTTTISYTVTNACGSSAATTTFTVITTPATPASITGTTTVCTSATSTLSSTTGGGTWSSSDGAVATVDPSTGVVTGVTVGSATITYTVSNACGSAFTTTAAAVITTPATPASITGTTTVAVSATTTLSSTTGGGTWSSSSTGVATVNSSTGVVTGVSAGSATITYTVTNSCGSSFVTTSVTVTSPVFTAGNLVVYTVNDTLSTGASISLKEYTTTGTAVNTINLPSSGTGRIVASGSASSEGMMTLDAELNHIILPGYDTSAGFAGVATAANVNRKIYSIAPSTTGTEVRNLSQTLVFNTNNIRSATANGSTYYGSGTATTAALGGVQLMAASSATKITNTTTVISNARTVQIFNGQLYVATGSGTQGVYAIGTGVPTTNSASTIAHGTGGGTSPYGFSISPDSNTLYIADDGAGIRKYTRSGGTGSFSSAYLITSRRARGLTVDYSTTPYTLYATTVETGNAPDSIIKITDNGASSAYTAIAGSQRGKLFRGITFTPANNATVSVTRATICSGSSDTVIFYGNPGATLNYTVNGSATSLTFDASGWKRINTGALSTTTTYALVSIVTSMGTTSLSGSTTITVNPLPVVPAITGTTTVCVAATTTLADTATGGTWASATPSVATISSGGVVTGVSAGTAVISYAKTNSCGTTTVTTTVTVNSIPVVGAITGTTTVCTGTTTTLADTSAGGTWSSSDASVATVNPSTGVVTGVTIGSATISYTVTGSCGSASATTAFAVTTTPTAPAAITGTTTFCTGATSTLSSTTVGGTWSSSNAAVATVDPSTGVVTGVAGGSANITYTVTNSCGTSFVTAGIVVVTTPIVGPILGATSVCVTGSIALGDTTAGGTWSSSNPTLATVSSTGTVYGLVAGSVTISYGVTGACGTAYSTSVITVNSAPSIGAITGATTVCVGSSITLSDTTAGGTWSSSATGVATVDPSTGVVYGVSAGVATISYGIGTLCGTFYVTYNDTVLSTPSVAAITGLSTIITGQIITAADATSGGTWSSSSTSVATISSAGVITGMGVGSTTISYTLSTACGSAFATATLNVNSSFGAGNVVVFRANGTANTATSITLASYTPAGALSDTITLPSTGTTVGGKIVCSGSATSEGGISLDSERVAIYVAGYDTTVGTTGSISGVAGVRREVYKITSGITASSVASVAPSLAYNANNIRSATAAGSRYYVGGTGSTGNNGVILVSGSSATQISTTITNVRFVNNFNGQLYFSTGSGTTGIYSVGTGIPTSSGTTATIAAAAPGPYGFAINPAGDTMYVANDAGTGYGIRKYYNSGSSWTFAYIVDTFASRGLAVDFTTTPYTIYATTAYSPGNRIIKIVDNGAGSSRTVLATATSAQNFRGITLSPKPSAKISVTTATVCSGVADSIIIYGNPGSTVNYTANGTPTTASIGANGRSIISSTYTNATGSPVTYTYVLTSIVTSVGTFTASGSATITVNPALSATITGTATICSGASTFISVAGGTPGSTITLSPGGATFTLDGGGGGSVAVSPTSTTTYTATITYATCTAAASGSVVVTVNPLPTANLAGTASIFSGSSTNITFSGTPNAKVYYTSNAGATTDSVTLNGSGSFVQLVSPSVTTTYALISVRNTSTGCTNTASDSAVITVTTMPYANISGTATVCSGLTTYIYFTGTPGGVVHYTDGSVTDSIVLGSGGSDSVAVVLTSTTTYSLIDIVSGGSTFSVSGSITKTIVPPVTAGTLSGATSVCMGDTTVIYSTTSSGGAWTTSAASVASVSSASGRIYPVSAGTATITYTVANVCFTDRATRSVTINALPTASISGTTSIYLGATATITFTGTPSATVSYTINGGSVLTITLDGSGSASILDTPAVTKIYALVSVQSTAGCTVSVTGSATITVTQPFSRYNLVVNRLGDGSTTLSSVAARQTLVEYTTAGSATGAVTSVPFSSGIMGTESGSATSGGQITLDSERTHIIISGYNAASGTTSVASAAGIKRTVFSVLPSAVISNVCNVAQSYAYNSNNIRSATGAGSRYYAAGTSTSPTLTGGIQLMSDTTSKQISRLPASNTRVVQVFNGQLYYSTASATPIGVYKVGTGIPTDTANVATSVNPTTTGLASPYSFSFSPDKKTLYITDDGGTGGIFKFTRTNDTASFTFAYKVTTTTSRSLIVDYTASPYIIYATTASATTNNTIIKITDTGASSATTTLASSGANYVFRGLTFAPASYAKVKGTVATVCSGSPDTVVVYGNPGATVNYTFNGASSSVALDGTGMKRLGLGTLTNTTPYPVNDTFKIVSVVTSLGTTTISDSTIITVNPLPFVPAITGAGTVCVGSSITVADTATYGTWSSSTPSVATISTTGVVTALSAGVDTISYSETNACGTTTVTALVPVNALPDAGSLSASPSSTCVGSLITLSETGTATGSGTLVSYNWSGPGGYSHTDTATTDTFTATTTSYSGVYSLTVTYSGTGCTSPVVTSGAITVNAAPTAYTVTGGGSYCGTTGLSIGLSNSDTGVSYQLYFGATPSGSPVAGTGSPISFGSSFTGIGSYTVTATGAGGCTPVAMTGSATITDNTVSIALGSSPSVCQPISSTSLSYSSAVGSPTTYSIAWSSTALADGFTNVTGASLGSTIPLVIPTGADTGYTAIITVSNGACTSTGSSITLTVYATPTAAITSATAPCSGYSTNVIFTGTPRAVITYRIDGGSPATATLTSAGTYSLSTGAITSSHTYYLLDAHNPVCSTSLTDSIVVNPVQMRWVGSTSTDWNTASNWSCGFVPGAGDDATIDSGTTNAPSLAASATGTTRNLTINSGAVLTINTSASMNVKGTFTNNSTVTGTGTLNLNNTTGAQRITGKGFVNNLNLNNSAGATIDTGSRMTINTLLKVTSGTLTTNDSLVMNATSTTTARVDSIPSGSGISGQGKVVVYIPGGRRAYRFWSHPFSNYVGLGQVQNYIDVTGPGGAANGFTGTATNAPSAFRYTPLGGNSSLASDPGWRQFANISTATDSNRLHQYQGIRLFFRGAKGTGLGTLPYTPAAVTVAQWGNLNQGTQTVTLAKGSASFQEYNMVGNPYASPVDIGTVLYNALVAGNIVGPAYFVWNPSLGTAGQFIPQFITTTTAVPYYLQACNAFQVRAAYNGSTLTFNESNKGNAPTTNLFKAVPEYVSLKVYDANYHPYDMLYVQFSKEATDNDDSSLDAQKPFGGADLNFYSLSADNHKMVIDARPYDMEKAIPLGLTAQYAQDYIIKAETVALPEGGQLYLHDKLLKQYVQLQAGAEYRFSISTDKATQGEGRFELSSKPAEAITATTGLKVTMTPNPATEEVKISFTSGTKENVAVRLMDLSGVSVYNQQLGVKQTGTVTIPLSKYATGIYMVELTSGNQKVVQRLIRE